MLFNMNWTDSIGRIHDKPTNGINPSSGNGWIYSAVYKKLGGELKLDDEAGKFCALNLVRNPPPYQEGQSPISRDEILGLAYLGYLKPEHLKGWSYSPYPTPKFNIIKLFKQASALVKWKETWQEKKLVLMHRNTFWKEGYDQIYRFAFSVPYSDRHFILQCWGKYNIFWHLVHKLLLRKPSTDRSGRQIRWLKTGEDLEALVNYHPANSPISLLAKEKLAHVPSRT